MPIRVLLLIATGRGISETPLRHIGLHQRRANSNRHKGTVLLCYDSAGRVSRQTYGNGNYIDFTYDNLDRITSKVYNGDSGKSAEYLYSSTGLISNLIDRFKNTRTKYTYDLANRLVGVREYSGTQLNGNILISSAKYNYEDKTNRLSSIVRNSLLGTQEIGYVYGNTLEGQNPDAVYTVKQNGIPLLNYTYDPLGRLSGRTLSARNTRGRFCCVDKIDL